MFVRFSQDIDHLSFAFSYEKRVVFTGSFYDLLLKLSMQMPLKTIFIAEEVSPLTSLKMKMKYIFRSFTATCH